MFRSVPLALALAACSFSGPGSSAVDGGDGDGDGDAGSDAGIDGTEEPGPWGAPVRLTELEFGNNPDNDNYDDPTITDGGTLYFAVTSGTNPFANIHTAERRPNGTFGSVERVTELSDTNVDESTIWVERDESRIVFARGDDLFEAVRDIDLDVWMTPVEIAELNTGEVEAVGQLTDGGLTLYFVSDRDGSFDIFKATRPALDEAFETPPEKLPVSSASLDQISVRLSADGLTMYWSEKADMAPVSAFEIVMSERSDTSADFGSGTPVAEVNTAGAVDSDFTPGPDHRTALFSSDRDDLDQGERIFFVER